MCVNQYIDGYKQKAKINRSIKEFLSLSNHKSEIKESFFEKLDQVIATLNSDQQLLLAEIYYSGKPMPTIAEELGISHASARKKKERLLKKVKSLFFD